MKKMFVLLTSCVLLLGLSSCGNTTNNNYNNSTQNDDSTSKPGTEEDIQNYGQAMATKGFEAEPAEEMKLSFAGIYEDKYYMYFFDLGTVRGTPVYSSIGIQYMNQDFEVSFSFEECSSETIMHQSYVATKTVHTTSNELGFETGMSLMISGDFDCHWTTTDEIAKTKAETNEQSYTRSFKTGYTVSCKLSEEKGFRRGYTYRVSFFETVRCYGVLLYDFDNDVYTYTYQTILHTSNKVMMLEESSNTYGEFDYNINSNLEFDFDKAVEMAEAEEPKFDKRVKLDDQDSNISTIYLNNNGNYVGEKPLAPTHKDKVFIGYFSQSEMGKGDCYINADMNVVKPITSNIYLFAHWVNTSSVIENHPVGNEVTFQSQNNDESNWDGLWQGNSPTFTSGYSVQEATDAIKGGYRYAKIRIKMNIFEHKDRDSWDWIAFKTIKNGQFNGNLQIYKVSVVEDVQVTVYFNFTIDASYLTDSELQFQIAYGISGTSKNIWVRRDVTTEFSFVKEAINPSAENIAEGGPYRA